MQVRVLFFGVLKDLAGRPVDSLDLPEHALLRDVLAHYEAEFPSLRKLSSSLAMSVNQEYASSERALHSGDEVGLLPPVSGGSGDVAVDLVADRANTVEIVRERIDVAAVVQKIRCPADGAVVVFEGVVRNNSRGRRTLFLDYEAYEEMALRQMNGLVEQAHSQFSIRQIALLHRVGRLQIGETSVLVVVASAHRGAAFDACRWLIDTLKRTVPIWKKEHFEDGAVWADGEPFPADIDEAPEQPAGKARI
jgi:MoaE-MoaD fusion protein